MPQPDFTRSLTEKNTKIISVCDKCGFTIIASVTTGLQEKEREHVKNCTGRPIKVPYVPTES